MATVEKVTDADTLKTNETNLRVGFINTQESVHQDATRNTEEGAQASEFASTVLPVGSEIQSQQIGTDRYGRTVGTAVRNVNGVDIDYGLVAMDQELSDYVTKFGENPDPFMHEAYSAYYSNEIPYQFGTAEEQMSNEDFTQMQTAHEAYTTALAGFEEGTVTQSELDSALVGVYADPVKVAQYRRQLSDFNRPIEQESEYTLRGSMRKAMEQDPQLREKYNRAVRNGNLMQQPVPEKEAGFMDKMGLAFSMFNDIANLSDIQELHQSRQAKTEFDVPDNELFKGIPDEFKSAVAEQYEKYGGVAALDYRDQLIEDVANQQEFDNLEWYAQLGYGAVGTLVSPTTLLTGGMAVTGGVVKANKAWQMSRAIGGKNVIKHSDKVAALANWTAVGATEGLMVNLPRLGGDHTYQAKDLMVDTLFDAGLGLAFGSVIEGMKPLFHTPSQRLRESRVKEQSAKVEAIKSYGKPAEAATPELQEVKDKVDQAKAPAKAQQQVKTITRQKYADWESVTDVSDVGYSAAYRTIRDNFEADSPVRVLLNKQQGLNQKNLPEEMKKEVAKLNSDILHLASAFPQGKVPTAIEQTVRGLTHTQKTVKHVDAMEDVLSGRTPKPTQTLSGYVDSLRNRDELWENSKPTPMTTQEFYADNSEILSLETIPQSMKFMEDMIELNKMSEKSDDINFIELVEELNGMVNARATERDLEIFNPYTDSTKSYGKRVQLTPPEIAKQLKKEGLQPRTTEYSERMRELRTEGLEVAPEVNKIGDIKQREVGRVRMSVHEDMDTGIDAKGAVIGIKEDGLDQDLLPRSYSESVSTSAYDNPDLETIKTLRERLNQNVLKGLGVKTIKGKPEREATQKRLEAIHRSMTADKDVVIGRMVKAGKWNNVEEVIRVAQTMLDESKGHKTVEVQEVEVQQPIQITEEVIESVLDGNDGAISKKMQPEEIEQAKTQIKDAEAKLQEYSNFKLNKVVSNFLSSGEREAWRAATKPKGKLDYVGNIASKLTTDLATKFQNSKLSSLEFVGSRITEIGKGYGGAIRRKATGGIIRDAEYRDSLMRIAPAYFRVMDDYAREHGKLAYGRMLAQQMSGNESKLVDKFNREVFTIKEYRRQGKALPEGTSPSAVKFADEYDKYMDANFDKLIDNHIDGFSRDRKVGNYIPHIWQKGQLERAIRKNGEDTVRELFTQAYMRSSTRGTNPLSVQDADELAKRQIDWILGTDADTDQFLPVSESRAKARLELDTTTEFNGLSILDLLDTDVIGISTKYSNRVGGWVGLSKSTDGAVTSPRDINTLRELIKVEGKEKGIDTKQYIQWFEDLENMMFGRPTRNGLKTELRELKDLTALTRMGGLGTAQAIESGQVITRSLLNSFSSEPFVKKVMNMAKTTQSQDELMKEIQAISSITDDLEHLERQSVHLDQDEVDSVNKARQLSLYLANKGTWGAAKAPASRLLGKTSGYNAVRRFQSRVVQASFAVDVAKHFKDGTGKMGNKRMADLGLTDENGVDEGLARVFRTHVEYGSDGLVKKLNVEQWPQDVREKFQYALNRDEAQNIQRTIVGELPTYMNRPLIALALQFRQMPLVANNKQLGRSMAFADKEAVTAVVLNTMMAGLVRYGKFAALGAGVYAVTGQEAQDPTNDTMQIQKYIAQLGVFPDATDLVLDTYSKGLDGADNVIIGQIPVLGLMNDYRKLGTDEQTNEQIDAAFGLVPLGNIAFADMLNEWLQTTFGGVTNNGTNSKSLYR